GTLPRWGILRFVFAPGRSREPLPPGGVASGSRVSCFNKEIPDVRSPFPVEVASWRWPAQAGVRAEADPCSAGAGGAGRPSADVREFPPDQPGVRLAGAGPAPGSHLA